MKNYLFTFFILLAGSCLFGQNIQLLGSTNTSAFGSGVSGVPNNLVWDIPAGQNRVMIIHLQFERDHSPVPPNSDNYPSGSFGANYFPITVGGVAMTGRSVLRGYYKLAITPGTASESNSDFSTIFYRYTLSDADGLPTGSTTLDFSGINLPVNISDEVAVSIEVYGNVSPTTSYTPTGVAVRDINNSNIGTISVTPTAATTPVGRSASDVMYVAFGSTSKDETLAINSGWTVINNMRITNNVSVLPIPTTGSTNPANEGDGISLLTAHRNGAAATTLTKSSNQRIVNFRLNIVPLLPLAKPSVAGTVYNDTDGLPNIDGTGTNGGGLYINAVNADNLVVYSVAVAADGTWTIPQGNVTEGSGWQFQLSKNQGVIGQPAPAIELNTGWVTVGEGGSTGNDGSPDGIMPVTIGTANVTGLRFGIVVCLAGDTAPVIN